MTDALLHLRRSENGHFVLVEPTSQTVVVAEDLAEAYARMTATLRESPPAASPTSPTFERRNRVSAAAVAVALLVPVLWLGWLALQLGQSAPRCPPRETASQGNATRVAPTPSASADKDNQIDDDENEDEAPARAAKPDEAKAEGDTEAEAEAKAAPIEAKAAVKLPPDAKAPADAKTEAKVPAKTPPDAKTPAKSQPAPPAKAPAP